MAAFASIGELPIASVEREAVLVIVATDGLAVAIVEGAVTLAITLDRTDALQVAVAEQGLIVVSLAAGDGVIPVLAELVASIVPSLSLAPRNRTIVVADDREGIAPEQVRRAVVGRENRRLVVGKQDRSIQ